MKRVLSSLAVGLLALSACAADQHVQRAGGTVMMAIPSKPNDVQMAIVGGTLVRTDRGCLASQDRSGGQMAVLQFPYGSTLAADGQSVSIPGVGDLHLGESFSGGGGSGDLKDLTGVPDECQDDTTFVSWQEGGAVSP